MILLKCCTQYVSTFGKLSRGHRTGKCQFLLQSQGRSMPNKQKKKSSNCQIIALIFHANKVMFKIVQARVQQYVNRELPDVQPGFRKDRETRDQVANICWIIANAREFQKNIYFCFLDYAKAFGCVNHRKL